ncbi:MAG: DUF1016 domain-containing protein [Chlorobium sp.]|nr:MAG: DUF1016 domain-containing protein [Chlorobium sp.]
MNKKIGSARQEPQLPATVADNETLLLTDLWILIQSARQRIATAAYSTQTLLSWHLGQRMLKENLHGARAAYGKQILVTVSRELTAEYGRGFSYPELARMVQFVQLFPEESIVVTLSQQLSWSHFHALLPIKDSLARDFCMQSAPHARRDICAIEQEADEQRIVAVVNCSGILNSSPRKGTRKGNRMSVRGIEDS